LAAVLAGEKTAGVLQIGDHGTTFGGNPLAAAAGLVVLETVANPSFLNEIIRKGEKFRQIIASWNHPNVHAIRGKGLMIGIDINKEAWPVLEAGVARASSSLGDSKIGVDAPGLLCLTAGKQTLRFLPPFIINDKDLEQGLDILRIML
jgi:acetylornithine/N-succinyldiaminopimelate aminotransferase